MKLVGSRHDQMTRPIKKSYEDTGRCISWCCVSQCTSSTYTNELVEEHLSELRPCRRVQSEDAGWALRCKHDGVELACRGQGSFGSLRRFDERRGHQCIRDVYLDVVIPLSVNQESGEESTEKLCHNVPACLGDGEALEDDLANGDRRIEMATRRAGACLTGCEYCLQCSSSTRLTTRANMMPSV